jgi:hypothetical protein
MLAKLLIPVVFGPAAAVVLAIGLTGAIEPPTFGAALAGFYLLLALAPWIALRPGLLWWVASPIAAVVGVPIAIAFVFSTMACFGANSGSGCAPQGPPFPLVFVFGIALGILGIAQAVTLTGNRAKVIWIVGSFVAGAAMGAAWAISSVSLPDGLPVVNYESPAVGGAVWGGVIAITMYLVERQRPRATTV